MKLMNLGLAALIGLTVACGDTGDTSSSSGDVSVPEVDVPSIEEAEADAAAEITEENMDDEMKKLAAELDADEG